MSAQAFNRISALERQVKELLERVSALESNLDQKTQACEPGKPPKQTLSLKLKADHSHA